MKRITQAQTARATQQAGAALITAILLVATATIVATSIYFDSFLYLKRSGNLLLGDQARMYALGAEDWVVDILQRDAEEDGKRDHLGEEWATVLPPLPIDGGALEGSIEDMQGRFNLNNLIDSNGEPNQTAHEQFQRLLEALGLPLELAGYVVDWIDHNSEPMFPAGAEDLSYSGKPVPYRTPNGAITTTTELLAIEGFDKEIYRQLAPFIAALPGGTTVNVNTATAPVLFALVPDITFSEAEAIAESRPEKGFETMEEFRELAESADELEMSLNSSYFRMLVRVTIGTHQQSMYSLLTRDAAAVRPVLRSFGSE